MNNPILVENQKKRLTQPFWMLVCFAMFQFWQMGFIYFVGPSLTIDGKTPLPVNMDNATSLIVICYILSIIWMIFLPKAVVWAQRAATGIAIASAVGLFLPLSADVLRLLIYVQIFSCCFMIGFETFLIVNYFSEQSNITHMTAACGISLFMIAILQNEFIPITFPTFRFIMVGALVLLMIFFLRMPASADALPRYVKKDDGLTPPKKVMLGGCIFIFVASLMAVSAPAIAGEVRHGVFIAYLANAVVSAVMYLLYKKAKLHPFVSIPVMVGIGGIGFLLMFASIQVPALSYVGCAFIGIGMVPCLLIPLYGSVMMQSYPSKYISPVIIGLALAAVIVQSSMVEAFRAAPTMLYLVYALIMAVLVFIYTQIEPFFLFTLRRRITDTALSAEETAADTASAAAEQDPLSVLTDKEKEVAELICLGYTNKDIAKVLFITENTAKDHTKSIYRKVDVHSRIELAVLVSNYRLDKK